MTSEKNASTVTTTTTASGATFDAAFWNIPHANEVKAFISHKNVAAIFNVFDKSVLANAQQGKYNPIDIPLGYDLTDAERKLVQAGFHRKGWDVKFVPNPGDKSLPYLLKVSVYFTT